MWGILIISKKFKKEKKGNKKCLQSFASFRGSRGGSCLMFILQHADSSAMGLVAKKNNEYEIQTFIQCIHVSEPKWTAHLYL